MFTTRHVSEGSGCRVFPKRSLADAADWDEINNAITPGIYLTPCFSMGERLLIRRLVGALMNSGLVS